MACGGQSSTHLALQRWLVTDPLYMYGMEFEVLNVEMPLASLPSFAAIQHRAYWWRQLQPPSRSLARRPGSIQFTSQQQSASWSAVISSDLKYFGSRRWCLLEVYRMLLNLDLTREVWWAASCFLLCPALPSSARHKGAALLLRFLQPRQKHTAVMLGAFIRRWPPESATRYDRPDQRTAVEHVAAVPCHLLNVSGILAIWHELSGLKATCLPTAMRIACACACACACYLHIFEWLLYIRSEASALLPHKICTPSTNTGEWSSPFSLRGGSVIVIGFRMYSTYGSTGLPHMFHMSSNQHTSPRCCCARVICLFMIWASPGLDDHLYIPSCTFPQGSSLRWKALRKKARIEAFKLRGKRPHFLTYLPSSPLYCTLPYPKQRRWYFHDGVTNVLKARKGWTIIYFCRIRYDKHIPHVHLLQLLCVLVIPLVATHTPSFSSRGSVSLPRLHGDGPIEVSAFVDSDRLPSDNLLFERDAYFGCNVALPFQIWPPFLPRSRETLFRFPCWV